MKICPACGRRSETEYDFCECGEYLGWVPAEQAVEQVRPTSGSRAPSQPAGGPAPTSPGGSVSPGVTRPRGSEPAGIRTAIPRAGEPAPATVVGVPARASVPSGVAPAPPRAGGSVRADGRAAAPRRGSSVPPEAGSLPPPTARSTAPAAPGIAAPTVLLGMYSSRSNRDAAVRAVTSVAAGGRSVLFAMIRNQSGIVDNYDLTIDGLPDGWWTTNPPTVYLVPLGRGEGYEHELEVILHPPRSPLAEARPWTIHLVATSRASGFQVASAGATVTIEPYHELESVILPSRADGRLGGRFEAIVANRANAPADVGVSVADDEDDLRFESDGRIVTFRAVRSAFSPFTTLLGSRASKMTAQVRTPQTPASGARIPRAAEQLVGRTAADQRKDANQKLEHALAGAAGEQIAADQLAQRVVRIGSGDSASVPFLARPRTQLWIGRRTNRTFSVSAKDLGAEGRPTVRSAILRQKPWLPTWFMLLVALIIIAIIVLLQLRPKNVTVPNVVKAPSVFAAEQTLQHAGLTLAPSPQTKIDPQAPSGSVVGQTPSAGSRVHKSTAVTVLIAIRSGLATVPSVLGETLAQADTKLGKAGFTLGSVLPKPDTKQIVASQVPAARSRQKAGTPVNVFLKPRPRKPKKAAGAAAGGGAAGGAGGAPAAGALTVPPFAGTTLATYQPKLASAQLTGHQTYRIDRSPPGTILATVPKPGTTLKAQAAVTVAVSAGFPLLGYDTGTRIAAVAGASGASSGELAIDRATQPAWDATGAAIAFVRGASIYVQATGQPAGAPTLVTPPAAGLTYDNPAFAPTRHGEIVAFASHSSSLDALCFSQVVSGRASPPSCLAVPGWRLGPITWGRSGYSLLVSATATDSSATFGLLQFFSSTRFAAQAAYWETAGTLVTPGSPGRGVLQAAISPDGKQLAAISNLGNGAFHVVLTKTRDLTLGAAVTLPTLGCAVAWRSDGGELAVVEGDPQCASLAGPILAIAPADPQVRTTLVLHGENPSWQPIATGRRR
ncbi:MAG: hypothetical protein QOH12_2372 [Solirubrobacteraceae bacterium]|nr:hypothetical protein [Solirubrobacteraceae bacterium]